MSGVDAKNSHEPYPEFDEIVREPSRHTKLPVIPDLRFEYSYLKSIQQFIEVERLDGGRRSQKKQAERFDQSFLEGYDTLDDAPQSYKANKKDGGYAEGHELVGSDSSGIKSSPHEVIKVQWKNVLWVTMRDQVISPLVQGALWALASHYLGPFSSRFGMGTPANGRKPLKDGEGISWLRKWLSSLRIGSSIDRRG